MLRLVKLSPDLVGTTSASILAYLLVAAKKFIVSMPKKHRLFWQVDMYRSWLIALKIEKQNVQNHKIQKLFWGI